MFPSRTCTRSAALRGNRYAAHESTVSQNWVDGMQRLPVALTSNPAALWPSLIRTRYIVGFGGTLKSGMAASCINKVGFRAAERRKTAVLRYLPH